ncbi:MAG: OmpA family protein, partial [Flavisolibacter sp.]|nr:OmpA family protein [Flavisolibacter sp.]
MKKETSFFVFFLLHCLLVYSQTEYTKHPSVLTIHYFRNDFKSTFPSAYFKEMEPGIGMSFIKGINRRLDWVVSANGSFPDSALKNNTPSSDKALLMETDMALKARMFTVEKPLQPYATIGFGNSAYKNHFSFFMAPGVGLQFNYSEIYFLFNTQYRIPLTQNLSKHFTYSIGIGGVMSKKKKKRTVSNTPALIQRASFRDRDNDGILDSADACPDKPGLVALAGCPDSDDDGIPDHQDRCPTLFGVARYNGCPIPDSDKDGLNDEEDKCPSLAGVARYQGCPVPDSDADGVNDEEDNCIDVPGVKEHKGCPIANKELSQQLNEAAKKIFFETGSYQLLSQSFTALDQVAQLLKNNPYLKLAIEGHTDAIGSSESNQALSENRANAVLGYLKEKGIAESRLKATGYGATRPL